MVKVPFLIIGLPRSRTSWLSMLFTVGPSFCHHDLSLNVKTIQEYVAELAKLEAKFTGSADSGAVLILDRLMVEMPYARVVYVRRDPMDAMRSFCRVTKAPESKVLDLFLQMDFTLRNAQKAVPGLTVPFSSLDDESMIRSLWGFVTKGENFPTAHYRRLQTMRVEPDPAFLQEVTRNGRDCVLTPKL